MKFLLKEYLSLLKELAPIRGVSIRDSTFENAWADGILEIETGRERAEIYVQLLTGNLSRAAIHQVIGRAKETGPERPWIVFAPYVGRDLARLLGDQEINFVDAAGNCRIVLGRSVHIERAGRRGRPQPVHGRGLGAAGFKVLFAIAAKPELLGETIRSMADLTGAPKSTIANVLARLRSDGLIAASADGTYRLLEQRRLIDRWIVGYETIVRQRLILGQYRMRETDPEAIERVLEARISTQSRWAFGGGAAAMRLTQHYRGETTVVHLDPPDAELPRRLELLPDRDGPIHFIGVPAKVAFESPEPRTVHPLLVYSELLASSNPRAAKAAEELRASYLEPQR